MVSKYKIYLGSRGNLGQCDYLKQSYSSCQLAGDFEKCNNGCFNSKHSPTTFTQMEIQKFVQDDLNKFSPKLQNKNMKHTFTMCLMDTLWTHAFSPLDRLWLTLGPVSGSWGLTHNTINPAPNLSRNHPFRLDLFVFTTVRMAGWTLCCY